ncbi:hypothetical protein ACN2CC_20390 [Mesorhizobium muleiense]|uniref:hypothetical protein n=1 Tax=Mesorhizobium muleiense TaxID=1004279 RepID=UPI003AFAEE79
MAGAMMTRRPSSVRNRAGEVTSAEICPEKYRLTGEANTGRYAACGVPPTSALQFSDERVDIVGNTDRCRNKPKNRGEAGRQKSDQVNPEGHGLLCQMVLIDLGNYPLKGLDGPPRYLHMSGGGVDFSLARLNGPNAGFPCFGVGDKPALIFKLLA